MPPHLDPAYLHRPKQAHPGPVLCAGKLDLKWYDLDEPTFPVLPATRDAARSYLRATDPDPDPDDRAGFVILHRCGKTFHFLLTCLWRGNNELWQGVHYMDGDMPAFSPFLPAYPALGAARPTFCVWELGIVAAEALAWQTYLSSPRTAADLDRWRQDTRQGQV